MAYANHEQWRSTVAHTMNHLDQRLFGLLASLHFLLRLDIVLFLQLLQRLQFQVRIHSRGQFFHLQRLGKICAESAGPSSRVAPVTSRSLPSTASPTGAARGTATGSHARATPQSRRRLQRQRAHRGFAQVCLHFSEHRCEIVRNDQKFVFDERKRTIRKPDVDDRAPYGDNAAVVWGRLSWWSICRWISRHGDPVGGSNNQQVSPRSVRKNDFCQAYRE
jgi:hypothetical protein